MKFNVFRLNVKFIKSIAGSIYFNSPAVKDLELMAPIPFDTSVSNYPAENVILKRERKIYNVI